MPHRFGVVRYKQKEGGHGTVKQRERIIQRSLTNWLRNDYPDVVFFNDWASGAYLTAGQNTARSQLSCHNGWVDLFIAEPSRGFHGLFIELKKEDVKIYLRDGVTLRANDQIRKEAQFLARQKSKGYCAMFAIGLEDAKKKIDWYFENEKPENVELF